MIKIYLAFIGPLLNTVSQMLKNKDANDTGPDDKAAAFLHFAALAITAIMNEQPIPQLPTTLVASLGTTDSAT